MFSRTSQYALQAMVKLAKLEENKYLTVEEVSQQLDIPQEFLAKIFQNLVKWGMLESRRGRGGGFALSRSPEDISFYEIIELTDGPKPLSDCIFDGNICSVDGPCPLHEEWTTIREEIIDFLRRNKISDLAG